MKKTFLSMAAMLLLATGVNAQKVFDAKVAKMADLAKLANRNKVELNVASTSTAKQNGMKKEGEQEVQATLVGFMPESTSVTFAGWPSVDDAMGVGAQMPLDENAYGYKVVGVRFAVMASLGVSPDEDHPVGAFVCAMPSDENATNYAAATGVDLAEGDYELSVVDGKSLDVKWNDVPVAQPFTIDNTMSALMWGLYYVQNTDDEEGSYDSYPFILCKYGADEEFPDANEGYYPFLALGSFGSNGFDWYIGSDATRSPYALCAYAICELPNGSTAVIGLNGSKKPVAQQYYTVDGKRLSAPQKGLNIVKLSNGETQKVYVK